MFARAGRVKVHHGTSLLSVGRRIGSEYRARVGMDGDFGAIYNGAFSDTIGCKGGKGKFDASRIRWVSRMAGSEAKGVLESEVMVGRSTDFGVTRGAEREKEDFCVGDEICGYRVARKMFLEERNFTVYELEHEGTGARHLHIECDDIENAFSIIFRTIPTDDKGIPHILEHMSLCGSGRYPVRDPFFKMLKRSLNSYMNACTGSDHTSFLFSTVIQEDYYNLMSVYLDAVFDPKLEYLDFLQEGHRVELQEDGVPVHGGVVYNEMKGALSDADGLFLTELVRVLYCGSVYEHNSGGDPRSIRELEYGEVLAFYRRFYHPSNSFTFTYGDLSLRRHLEFISSRYLSRYARVDLGTMVFPMKRWAEPRRVVVKGPLSSISNAEKQTRVSVSWVTNDIMDDYASFLMSVVSYLLLNGPNAPLYRALITSKVGSMYSPGTGYNSSFREAMFSVGVLDAFDAAVDDVERTILETLQCVVAKGFDAEHVKAVLHRLELLRYEVTTGYGLALLESILSYWINGNSPLDAISLRRYMERLEGDLSANPRLFQELVARELLGNGHRLTFAMIPDTGYASSVQECERSSLEGIRSEMNRDPGIGEKFRSDERRLKEYQAKAEEDLSVLPRIHLGSIPREFERVKSYSTGLTIGNESIPVLWNPQHTNGMVYFRAIFDVSDLPGSWLPYLPVGTFAMHRLGTRELGFEHLSRMKDARTGSFSADANVIDSPNEASEYRLEVGIYSSCLSRNIEAMFDIWRMVVEHPRFEEVEYFKTLVSMMSASMHNNFIDSGHLYSQLLAASAISPPRRMNELWNGLSQYEVLRDLNASKMGEDARVIDFMPTMVKWIFDLRRSRIAINAEEKDFATVEKCLLKFFGDVSIGVKMDPTSAPHERAEGLVGKKWSRRAYVALPSQVNFVSQVLPTVAYAHEDYGKFDVAANLMSSNFLHREIREKRGAYGSGVIHNGMLNFYSYRDPCVEETLESFAESMKWLTKSQYTDEELEEAKIQIFSRLDAPLPPSKRGLTHFRTGITDEMRQRERDAIFDTTRDDIMALCEKYLNPDRVTSESSVAVFGSDQNERFKNDSTWTWING